MPATSCRRAFQSSGCRLHCSATASPLFQSLTQKHKTGRFMSLPGTLQLSFPHSACNHSYARWLSFPLLDKGISSDGIIGSSPIMTLRTPMSFPRRDLRRLRSKLGQQSLLRPLRCYIPVRAVDYDTIFVKQSVVRADGDCIPLCLCAAEVYYGSNNTVIIKRFISD